MQNLSIRFATWGLLSLSAIALTPVSAAAQVFSVYQLPELPAIDAGSAPDGASLPAASSSTSSSDRVLINVGSPAGDRPTAANEPVFEPEQRRPGRGQDKPKHSKRDRDKGDDNENGGDDDEDDDDDDD